MISDPAMVVISVLVIKNKAMGWDGITFSQFPSYDTIANQQKYYKDTTPGGDDRIRQKQNRGESLQLSFQFLHLPLNFSEKHEKSDSDGEKVKFTLLAQNLHAQKVHVCYMCVLRESPYYYCQLFYFLLLNQFKELVQLQD